MSANEIGKTIKTWASLAATIFILGVAWNTYGARLMNVEGQADSTEQALKSTEDAFGDYKISNANEHTKIKLDIKGFSVRQEIVIKQQDKMLDKLDEIQKQIK